MKKTEDMMVRRRYFSNICRNLKFTHEKNKDNEWLSNFFANIWTNLRLTHAKPANDAFDLYVLLRANA